MKILKYVLATLLFIALLELTSYFAFEAYLNILPEEYYKYYLPLYSLFELLVIVLLLFLVYKKSIYKSFKLSYRFSLIAISLGLAYVYIQFPLNKIYNLFFDPDKIIVYDFISTEITTWKFIAFVVFIPTAEELFFRGYIQEGLNKYLKPILAILISSALFSLIHFPYVDLFYPLDDFTTPDYNQFYITFFGGLISALLYQKSKSLVPSILFHMSWNLWVILV